MERKLFVAVRENGTFIKEVKSFKEALETIRSFELEDFENDDYVANYYEIEDENHITIPARCQAFLNGEPKDVFAEIKVARMDVFTNDSERKGYAYSLTFSSSKAWKGSSFQRNVENCFEKMKQYCPSYEWREM